MKIQMDYGRQGLELDAPETAGRIADGMRLRR